MSVVARLASVALAAALAWGGLAAPVAEAGSRACTARTEIAARPGLVPGDAGSCVRTLQNLLMTKGFDLGYKWPGGTVDAQTVNAVKSFQGRAGLAVTGRVDQATWVALDGFTPLAGYRKGRGPNLGPNVVLSFDDCPRSLPSFKATVRAATALGIGLVLFPTGQCLKAGRFSASYARAHGHWVFNHSVSHPDLRKLSFGAAFRQLGSPGVVTTIGRPPYGATDAVARRAYAARGMRIWLWTFDTRDWTGLSRDAVVNLVVDNATAGSTMLMHLQWRGFSPTALRLMVDGLAARGLRPCVNLGTTPSKPTLAQFSC